ncbi:hypothetical protein Tco_0044435, partial [Tanacetum coccineum]
FKKHDVWGLEIEEDKWWFVVKSDGDMLENELKEYHLEVEKDLNNIVKRSKVVRLYNEYTKASQDELKLLYQTAKVDWLREGDKNTAYFQNFIKARIKKNRVDTICNEDGLRFDGEDASGQFVKHFKCFIRTVAEVQSLCYMGDIFKCRHTIEEAKEMIINVTDNEIKEAILDIDSNKAPGLGKLLGEVNATIIALVLKLITPNKWIIKCVTTSAFLRCVNGEVHGTLKENEKQELLNIMPFKSRKLPMRYLGVPLLAKKLGINDCKCLVYRAFVYMLHMSVIKEINSLLKRFVWNAGESTKGKLRIAWKVIYRPKDQEVDVIDNANWSWPSEWTNKFLVLANFRPPNLNDKEDSVSRVYPEVVPKVDDVSLVDGVFDGAFGGDREEDFVMGEGVVVSSSSLERSTKSFLGGIMVSLILLEGLEEEACVNAMEVEKK